MPEHGTTAPEVGLTEGQASDVPAGFFWPLWIGVFAAVTWGMMHLFGSHRK